MLYLDSKAFSSGGLIEYINQGLTNIILKNAHRDTIESWRLITLFSVAYKIMSKEMAL